MMGFPSRCKLVSFITVGPGLMGPQDYEEVELGYPSNEDELINDYAEDDDYTGTVYGYVPIEVVEKLIEKHGGIKI